MRRIAGAVVVVVGLGMIASLFALSLFTRADQGKAVLDGARPVLVGGGLTAMRRDLTHGKPAVAELNALVPEFASRLGLTTDAFLDRFPGVRPFAEQAADIEATADKIVTNLEHHVKDFKEADSIPTKSSSPAVMPWIALGVGIVLAALGLLVLLRGSWLPLALAMLVGVAMVAAPLALRLPQKSAASADVLDSLNAELNGATKVRRQLTLVTAARREIPRALGEVAAASNVTVSQLQDEVRTRFPDLGFVIDNFKQIQDDFLVGVRFREKHQADIGDLKDSPVREGPWFQIGAGALVALVSLAGLVRGRRRRD
jgi:hypothetical protein